MAATSPTRRTTPVPRSSTVSTSTHPSPDSPLTRPITPTCGEGRDAGCPMRTTRPQGARRRRGTGVPPSMHGPTTTTSRCQTLAGMYLRPRGARAPTDTPPHPLHVTQSPANNNGGPTASPSPRTTHPHCHIMPTGTHHARGQHHPSKSPSSSPLPSDADSPTPIPTDTPMTPHGHSRPPHDPP